MDIEDYVYAGFAAVVIVIMSPILIPLFFIGWVLRKIENYLIERKLNKFK